MKHYDAVIIGAGQAGVPLAKKLAESGKKTAIIEKRLIGGTCINDGCTPTKAMIAAARKAYEAANSADLGIEVDHVHINFKAIKKRKDDIVESFRASAEKGLKDTKGLDVYMGTASFTAEKELIIVGEDGNESSLSAELIFINTGAEPIIPEIEGIEKISYLTSTSILELDEIPKQLLVVGGNYIGLEFGQMFSRFGSQVTILEKSSRILAKEDPDISEALTKILGDEKIEIFTGTEIKKLSPLSNQKIKVDFSSDEKTKDIEVTHILFGIGRKPQTEYLGLEKCGVDTDEHGYILVNDKLETSVKGIYALGDVKGGPAFTHIAYNDYTIVYRNLIEGTDYSIKERPIPYCMFTDPQLGRVGLSETEAKEKKIKYKVAVLPMENVARGIETGETKGLMKAIVNAKTKEILGAAVLASEGGEVMSVLQMAMEGGITYDRIRYCVFAHPTFSESLNNLFMSIED